MEFGPYTVEDARNIQAVLDAKGLQYEIDPRREELDAKMEQWKIQNQENVSRRGVPLDTSHVYILLEEGELEKLGDSLENYGISRHAHAEHELAEEYYCQQCDHRSDAPGNCPKHHNALVDYVQYREGQRGKGPSNTSFMVTIGVVVAALFLLFFAKRWW